MSTLRLQQGDITTATTDAIVNAANPVMLGGGGVDGAIHRAAGPALLEACRQVPAVEGVRCPTGEARITSAGVLAARYVIHTVGPIYHQSADPARLLTAAYAASLRLARQYHCHSIAFPAISCGVYGYPIEDAAYQALRTCMQEEFHDLEIVFYLFDEHTLKTWQTVLQNLNHQRGAGHESTI